MVYVRECCVWKLKTLHYNNIILKVASLECETFQILITLSSYNKLNCSITDFALCCFNVCFMWLHVGILVYINAVFSVNGLYV